MDEYTGRSLADIEEIRDTIQNYFDGLYDGDLERMRRAFHPCCHLYSVSEGSVQDESAPDWFQRIQNRPSPASQGAARRDEIIFIDLNGTGSALAKVQVCLRQGVTLTIFPYSNSMRDGALSPKSSRLATAEADDHAW
jgi:hypothetical protein